MSLDQIKKLREETSLGVMAVKRALEDARGDPVKARQALSAAAGGALAQKADRPTPHGVVAVYGHLHRIGAMVEVRCETDFVARSPDFGALVKNVTLHVASMNPPDVPTLLGQPFCLDESATIGQMVERLAAQVGENIRLARFIRFELGTELSS